MASTSQTNPAYDIPSFNARDHLVTLHQEITNFLHYQLHVQYAATASLPPNTSAANQQERQMIIEFLKEECAQIKMLKRLLDMVDDNAAKLHCLFEESPISNDVNWEKSTGDPRHNGNNHCCHHSITSSLADRVKLIDMVSGADTPIRGDKRKASEAASNSNSPEGQPLKMRSRTDMRAAAKVSGSGVQAMGPPRPLQASRDKKIECLENQLVYAKEAFRLSVENIQEQLDQLKEEEAKAVMVTKKGSTSGARGCGGSNSKGKSK